MTDCNDKCTGKTQNDLQVDTSRIKHRIMVLSGKGGVGKSSIAACLALGLTNRGFKVGVMDIDFHGPSIPVIFGLEGERVWGDEHGIFPIAIEAGLKVISIGFFLQKRDDAIIWRGPLKMTAIRQFLEEIHWGDLDYLLIDSPPGTGDEPLSIAQMIPGAWGLIITTPQELAAADVRKSITFCRKTGLRLLGLVENMNGMICPYCKEKIEIFGRGSTERLVNQMQVEMLASLPLDRDFAAWADRGGAREGHYRDLTEVAASLDSMVERIIALTNQENSCCPAAGERGREPATELAGDSQNVDGVKLFAIPTENGILCEHFGHCEQFTLVEVSEDGNPVIREVCAAPPHEPGLLPRWLASKGVNTVIAGGMGTRAKQIFQESGIEVICGAPPLEPLEIVRCCVEGNLELGENVCDH
jgi:Mrp family chromosome partitioning ATPase/predicted Fe-Mo cluster-binding NifX family protein